MRVGRFLGLFVTLALGCGPGLDPSLGPCNTRGTGAVVIGTGEESFARIPDSGVPINEGQQGGFHIWLGLSCKNLGPKVTAKFAILDVATGRKIGLVHQALELEYNGRADEIAGVYGYLSLLGTDGAGGGGGDMGPLPSDLTGRTITILADVSDACGKPATHAAIDTVIAGYR